eukprot:4501553-Karenia_brevis.AAC.1
MMVEIAETRHAAALHNVGGDPIEESDEIGTDCESLATDSSDAITVSSESTGAISISSDSESD